MSIINLIWFFRQNEEDADRRKVASIFSLYLKNELFIEERAFF